MDERPQKGRPQDILRLANNNRHHRHQTPRLLRLPQPRLGAQRPPPPPKLLPPSPVRGLSPKSYAVLPIPADWDARLWTARLTFELDTSTLASGNGIGLFKIRIETGGEILVRVRNDNPYPGITVKVEWHGNRLAKEEYQSIDDQRWISDVG